MGMFGRKAKPRTVYADPLAAKLPDGRTVGENVTLMRRLLEDGEIDARNMGIDPSVASTAAWPAAFGVWLGSVWPGGQWDPKLKTKEIGGDRIGNINYGATGSTLFPAGILTRAAGAVQLAQHMKDPSRHPYKVDWGNPLTGGGRHVGDDPRDTADIMRGIMAAGKSRKTSGR